MEIVRRACEANRSGPPDATVAVAVALADPNVEFLSRLTSVEGSAYCGYEGVRRYFADMADAWEEWRVELAEITELGEGVVMTNSTFRATGRSGVEVELRNWIVWVVGGGQVLRMHAYTSRDEALEAAGLSE